MRKRSILALGGALAIIASLVVGPAATAGPERASAGTAVIIHDQEPGILNPFLSEGNGYTVALVMNKILNAGVIYNNKVQVVPELLDGSPEDPEQGAVEGHRDVQADGEVESTASRSPALTSWPRTRRS